MNVLARLDRLPWSSHQRRVVGTLALCFAFELADINTFAYAAPAVRDHLGISVRAVSFITSAGARWVPDAADQDPVQPSPGVRPLETG